MRAIPKELLIHEVMYHKQIAGEDFYDEESLNAGTMLTYVRMEPSNKIIRDKNNAEIQLVATMFYDCKNSRPKGIPFAVDDVVIFNGMKHKVQIVEPLYDKKKLHHYELGLIKHA